MKKLTTETFISSSISVHGIKYDYSYTNYIDSYSYVDINCSDHGIFSQRANHHLRGHGCPYCSGVKSCTLEFIKKSTQKHGNKYDYSKVNYINKRTKVEIICKIHGVFVQEPRKHLFGQGCPSCNHYISKQEVDFLDYMKIDKSNRQVYINGYKIDGYDPKTKSIYEFLGDYWHGNPKKFNHIDWNVRCNDTYKSLYDKTMAKFNVLKSNGFTVKYIWESDWKDHNIKIHTH